MLRHALQLRVVLALSLLAPPLTAQGARPKPLPILDAQTFLVMRFEINQLDFKLLGNWVTDVIANAPMPDEQKAQIAKEIPMGFEMAAQFRDALAQNGVEHIYLAWSTATFPRNDDPTMFATLAPNADAQTAAILMLNGPSGRTDEPPDPANARPQQTICVEMAGGVFRGRADRYKQLRDAQPEDTEVQKLLAAAPPAGLYVVLVPNADLQAFVARESQNVPVPWKELLDTAARVSRHISATVQPPPGMSGHIEIHATDPAAAKLLKDQMMAVLPEIAKLRPGDPDAKALLGALTPVQKDAILTIELDEKRLAQIVQTPLALATGRARTNAMRVQSASNLRQITLNLAMHADRHNGNLPDRLEELGLPPQLLKNPRGGAAEPDYIYLKPAAPLPQVKNPGQTVVAYENPADLPDGEGVNVAFADGHVEFTMRQRLQGLLGVQGAPKAP